MKVRELLNKLKEMSPDALVCVAELDEAFAANVAELELVRSARAINQEADGREAVDLSNGNEEALVIRW